MILVADNIQITNKTIENALKTMRPDPIQEMAKQCEAAGAEMLDINSGPLSRDPEAKMTFLVEAVQEVSSLPILIDTANSKAVEAGLRANKKTAVINGFSLEPAKLESILPLAKKFDVDIIGYLLYPNSHVPPDESERLNVAMELYNEFQNAGLDKDRLIIDPVVVPVLWENGNIQAMEVMSVIKTLPDLLGFDVRTIAGVSNLTTGKGNKEKKLVLEKAYLPMLASAGLTMALLNVFHSETIRTARACNALADPMIFTWEAL
ncbi:dihydropteroate synthase [Desulfonema magnum]|uniref:Pterin-binding domain-containing protein n=1 Tax=Desulfonema magnum TaxID=45655 RepID=A0A975GQ72_9BACT|nr:dihydropteroate synthase [Desulfonema magnum]QTA89756.1 Pterin-binding domain-containing protein [Desulfonema magnum]